MESAEAVKGDGSHQGDRGRERARMGPMKFESEFTVSEAVPGRRFTWRVDSGPYAAVLSPVLTVERALSEHAAAQSALAWAIPLITVEAAARAPVRGGWSVAQNLAHLVVYEELIALPILGASLRHEDGARYVRSFSEDWLAPESESLATAPFPQLLTRYDMAERRHAELLAQFDDEQFNAPLCSAWRVPEGRLVSAGWVAKKSLQHTWEHGNVLLRAGWMALV